MRLRAIEQRSNAELATLTPNIFLYGLCALVCVANIACGSTSMFRQYEYEEDIYLSLDGSATVYVNASIPALNALRGATFDANPNARTDRDAVRRFYAGATSHDVGVRTWRRNNRRFVQVKVQVDDIRRLSGAAPFAWSSYSLERQEKLFLYRQAVGSAADKAVGPVNWNGRELVAFRLHLPSKVTSQNTQDKRRGNILVWEQPLADRLKGVPLVLEVQMETQSILYRTLWLFGATFLAVAVGFVLVIGWVMKRSSAEEPQPVRARP